MFSILRSFRGLARIRQFYSVGQATLARSGTKRSRFYSLNAQSKVKSGGEDLGRKPNNPESELKNKKRPGTFFAASTVLFMSCVTVFLAASLIFEGCNLLEEKKNGSEDLTMDYTVESG